MLPSVYLIALIGFQVASANRVLQNTQNITDLLGSAYRNAKSKTKAQNVKNVVFMRHGLSMGNWVAANKWNPIKVAVSFGWNPKKAKEEVADGELHKSGEEQVVGRVGYMTLEDIDRIVATEVVLVSPLKRAMATALILLAKAYCKHDHYTAGDRSCKVPDKWPKIVVVPTLREQAHSISDVPGPIDGVDGSAAYIERIAKDYSRNTFKNAGAMDTLVEQLHKSLKEQKDESVRYPETDMKLIKMIDQFKQYLSGLPESKILAVGHGTWSRTAFSAFMPNPNRAGEDVLLANVINGQRSMMILNNAGVLEAEFDPKENMFTSIKLPLDGVQPGTRDLPNCQSKKGKPKFKMVALNSFREAQLASVVPDGSLFEHFEVKYEKASGRWTRRMVTLSRSKAGVNFAWLGGSEGHDSFHIEIYKLPVDELNDGGRFLKLPSAFEKTSLFESGLALRWPMLPALPEEKYNFVVDKNDKSIKFNRLLGARRDVNIKFVDEQDFKTFANSLTNLADGYANTYELTGQESWDVKDMYGDSF